MFSKLALVALAGLAAAAPMTEVLTERANLDLTVLQFALTLEHLENAFYHEALGNFSVSDFEKSGYSADYYNNIKYISFDEQTHVTTLTAAIKSLDATPVAACSYNFAFDTVKDFITVSSILEGVGTSAYLGAAPLITSKYYLTVAGSILAVEALHTSMQRLALGEVPMANPFYTPLDPMSVYTLAASFITACPKGNPALPFTAFLSLTSDGKLCQCEEPDCEYPGQFVKRSERNNGSATSTCTPPSSGATVSFTAAKTIPAGSYLTFVNGLAVTSVPGTISSRNISGKVPTGLGGQTYVFVTKSNVETTFDDTQVLYGPAIIEVDPAAPVTDDSIM